MTAFEKARAEERFNRLLAYLSRAPALSGCPVVPITARAIIELETFGNACVAGGEATKEAVFDFLWRLNPDFARPLPGRERLLLGRRFRGLRVWLAFGSLRVAAAYRRVERHVAAADFSLPLASLAIKARRATAYQDQAAGNTEDAHALKSQLAPDRHWVESFIDFYCVEPGKWRVDDVLDAPLAQLFQIYREHELARGHDPARFITASDALIGPPAS